MYKKIFIFIVFAVGLFWISPVFANDSLTIEFENEPLFNEANFLPGESITRWVKVTNNSEENQRIAAEAINVNNSSGLGYALVLEITEDSQSQYINNLSQFFNAGEVYLSNLASGNSATYNFSITFYPESNNTFQGKSLGFDILIGFQGEGGGLPPGSGSGGGGFLPPGLTIREPIEVIPETTSAIIVWDTNYASTSRVVYSATSGQFDLSVGEPSYGYDQYTEEDSTKAINHSMTLTGLSVGTTYYYRCVSHGSFAVSTEYNFTTLESGEPEEIFIEQKSNDREQTEKNNSQEGGVETRGITKTETEENDVDEEVIINDEDLNSKSGGFLASIGGLFSLGNLSWLLITLIVLIILFLLFKKKKKEEE